ncbi:hypothetical protein PoB_001526300 [Plakobranchus ocellatus]|uniref:Uncharacterized protein n=1 Tax=Plakobranchus ocellatus TaxID=259542 RepID=A0AAV3Z1W6_9GAST|nr:hypothetical protein PoB_001526300 [Plakobranchus ocellatus]
MATKSEIRGSNSSAGQANFSVLFHAMGNPAKAKAARKEMVNIKPHAKNNQDPTPGSPMLGLSVGPNLLKLTGGSEFWEPRRQGNGNNCNKLWFVLIHPSLPTVEWSQVCGPLQDGLRRPEQKSPCTFQDSIAKMHQKLRHADKKFRV